MKALPGNSNPSEITLLAKHFHIFHRSKTTTLFVPSFREPSWLLLWNLVFSTFRQHNLIRKHLFFYPWGGEFRSESQKRIRIHIFTATFSIMTKLIIAIKSNKWSSYFIDIFSNSSDTQWIFKSNIPVPAQLDNYW